MGRGKKGMKILYIKIGMERDPIFWKMEDYGTKKRCHQFYNYVWY
jgi:hypothetical protein